MSKKMNAFYAQSGGVTAVINASACGVIETARKHKDKIGKVYAGRNGIIGALTEDLIDTTKESKSAIAGLRHTPSGAFGSCRFKLKSLEDNQREYERLIEVFKAHNIGYFFYNGGGDSADTCLKCTAILSNEKYRGIRFRLGKGLLHLQAHNPEQDEAEEEVEVDYDGAEMTIGFNVGYLLDVLGVLDGDQVQMAVIDSNSSSLVTQKGSTDCRYVVMPMRL